MSMAGIDLNRGVVIRTNPVGIRVHMYKDEPGVYRDAYGNEVNEKIAASVGFDVKPLAKAKSKAEKLAAARAQIEAEDGEAPEGTALKEAGGYRVMHMGFGRYLIFDEDDNKITPEFLKKKEALDTLDKLAA